MLFAGKADVDVAEDVGAGADAAIDVAVAVDIGVDEDVDEVVAVEEDVDIGVDDDVAVDEAGAGTNCINLHASRTILRGSHRPAVLLYSYRDIAGYMGIR